MTIYNDDEQRLEAIECLVKNMHVVCRDDVFFLFKKGNETMRAMLDEIKQLKKELRKEKRK